MSRKWGDDNTLQFINLYRNEECLWDIRSQNYRNKQMRITALQNICSSMNMERLTIEEVKAKIKSLRCTYNLELDKISKSTRSGAGGDVYVPKIKWFTEFHEFIRNVAVKRVSVVSKHFIYSFIITKLEVA